jgi:hypothetical protein
MLQRGAAPKTRTVIYYQTEWGDDDRGDGSERYPFRTYNGAVKKLPLLVEKPIRIRNLDYV